MVVGRSLEHPVFDRIGDLDARCAGDQGDFFLFSNGYNSHGLTRGAWSNDYRHLVILDQLGRQLDRLGSISGGIIDDRLQLNAVNASFRISLANQQLQGLLLRLSQK